MRQVICKICESKFFTKTTGLYCSDECKKIQKRKVDHEYYLKNTDHLRTKRLQHYQENKLWYQERDKKKTIIRRKNNPNGRVNRNLSHLTDEERKKEIKNKYNKRRVRRYKLDEVYNLQTRYRSLLNKKIREEKLQKNQSSLDFLGCDWETFKKHIESKFHDGMSWENRNRWELDHIIPISEGKNIEDVKFLSHYTNFQPLWKEDNLKKSNKW